MPVELEWHSELPVLVATYTGTLTRKAYDAMCAQRRKMLDEGLEQVILLADTRALESVTAPASFERDSTVFFEPCVAGTFIVLTENLYRRVLRAVDVDNQHQHPMQFFKTIDAALDAVSIVMTS